MVEYLLIALVAVALGLLIGWLAGKREVAALRTDRDAQAEQFRRAITDLAAAEERAKAAETLREELTQARDEREAARLDVSRLTAEGRAAEQRIADLKVAADEMTLRFKEVAQTALTDAQKAFLERAEARLRQSEEQAGQGLKALLQPVNDRLLRYEEGVALSLIHI